MAPVVVDPRRIKTFASEEKFAVWLAAHHDRWPEVWIKIHKKASGRASITPAQAIDATLVAMLARGETIVPQAQPKAARKRSD